MILGYPQNFVTTDKFTVFWLSYNSHTSFTHKIYHPQDSRWYGLFICCKIFIWTTYIMNHFHEVLSIQNIKQGNDKPCNMKDDQVTIYSWTCQNVMMTSWNGNFFHVTGPLSGEFTSLVNSPLNDQWCRALMFSLIYAWINNWINNF